MKIDFAHAGTKVECKVSINVPNCGEVTWTFDHEHTDKFYAGFVCSAMQMQMREALEKARRESYEKGWKDAKSKKAPKATWFSRLWPQ